jgi:hypothetical protein
MVDHLQERPYEIIKLTALTMKFYYKGSHNSLATAQET